MTSSTLRSLLCVLSCAVVGATISTQANAQQPRTTVLGFSGGVAVPLGDFADQGSAGYEIGVHLFVAPHDTKKNLSFRGDVIYDGWGGKTVDVGKFRGIGVFGNGLYALGNKNMSVRPYLIVGGGFQNFQRTFPTNTGDSGEGVIGDTKIAVQGGGGFQFYLRGFSAFLEARYIARFGESTTNWVPVTFGFHF
ncbi:MAG: hypothetical protein ABJB66_19400 [Gemmatimonadaceae bacterium]